jgi:hypothetical protein
VRTLVLASLIGLLAGSVAASRQSVRSDPDEVTAAAVRWVINDEIRRLARTGLPRVSERLAFCIGAARKDRSTGPAPASFAEFNAALQDSGNPSQSLLARLRDERFDLFGREGCRPNGLGTPIDQATNRATRGEIRVGPTYESGPTRLEVPVQILRHISSADGWVLRLESTTDGWQVVGARHVWGA